MTNDEPRGSNEANKCSLCQKSGHSGEELSSRNWFVMETTDYRKRDREFPGFPQSETLSVQGWKLRNLREFQTLVCRDCFDREDFEVNENVRAARRVALILSPFFIGVSTLLIVFASSVPIMVTFLGAMLALVLGGVILICFFQPRARPEEFRLHDLAAKRESEELDIRNGKNENVADIAGFQIDDYNSWARGTAPTIVGWLFVEEAAIHKTFAQWEARTGWSLIHCLSTLGVTGADLKDPDVAASELGVEHLGQFLDQE